jgi:glucose/arabinose dehydrogenase
MLRSWPYRARPETLVFSADRPGDVAILGATLLLVAILGVPPLGAEPAVSVVAAGLEVPWALTFAPDGRLFVTERPGRIRVVRDGRLDPSPVGSLAVAAAGEGGLMGLALDPRFGDNGHLYVCYTRDKGGELVNRLSRLTVRDGRLVDEHVLVDDMAGAGIHDGCRVKIGPDRKLYFTMGDAGRPQLAQQRDSLNGKVLRLETDGRVPTDNPFPGSLVYSLGHRNPQGLAWDSRGRLIEAEHGPSGVPCCHDEINLIEPGRNYGWPDVYGRSGADRYVDPLIESGLSTWAPSGIAILGDQLYVAALRGRRLLRFTVADPTPRPLPAWLEGTYGRLREVVVGPDGALYVTTSNRDGRGRPTPEDDRILRVVP